MEAFAPCFSLASLTVLNWFGAHFVSVSSFASFSLTLLSRLEPLLTSVWPAFLLLPCLASVIGGKAVSFWLAALFKLLYTILLVNLGDLLSFLETTTFLDELFASSTNINNKKII